MKDEVLRNVLLQSFNLNPANLVLAKQIHSANVIKVSKSDAGKFIENCDGLITSDKNLILGIFTADCMPVLISSKDGSVRAAVHSGWKGLAGGTLENAVNAFKEFGVAPQELEVYIGPHIRECCYEVGPDFERIFGAKLSDNKFSLAKIAIGKMIKLGISEKDISVSPDCTFCGKKGYFSYRKNKTENRHLTFIF